MHILHVNFFFFFFHIFADNFHRNFCKTNPGIKLHSYSGSGYTASGPLCAHLLACHAEEWAQACWEKNIDLRGKEGEEALARVTGVPVDHQAEAQVPFTQDNFIVLVQFIVATDQVFIFFPFLFVLTVFLGYKGCWEARILPPMCPAPSWAAQCRYPWLYNYAEAHTRQLFRGIAQFVSAYLGNVKLWFYGFWLTAI